MLETLSLEVENDLLREQLKDVANELRYLKTALSMSDVYQFHIGSDHVNDVKDWLDRNIPNTRIFMFKSQTFIILKSFDDAVLFKMRWS